MQQAFINLRTGRPGPLPPPIEDIARFLAGSDIEALLKSVRAVAQVGAPDTVKRGLEAVLAGHHPDELMVAGQIYDHQAHKCSYELLASL